MKHATAVRHLVEIGEEATDRVKLRGSDIGWPLEEIWTAGELLDGSAEVETGNVILLLDAPPHELPWMSLHPTGEWIGDLLRLNKRPVRWSYRPAVYPAWGTTQRRVVRFWTAAGGLQTDVIGALSEQRVGDLPVVEPTDEELAAQLSIELPGARQHLHQILDAYWEQGWRRDHKGFIYPEDHLWRAAEAVREIETTLAELGLPGQRASAPL